MEFHFSERPDGIIEVSVDSDRQVFDHALSDAVSSRGPRGAVRPGLSTYWIDRAEAGVRNAARHGRNEPFASGNVTNLRLDGSRVVAAYDFDPDENKAETVPLEDFLALLDEWRRRVIDAGGASGVEARLASGRQSSRPMGPAT